MVELSERTRQLTAEQMEYERDRLCPVCKRLAVRHPMDGRLACSRCAWQERRDEMEVQ